MFDLKLLTPDAIPRALDKAGRYRLLNEPGEAESICEDVLRIDPTNQQALIALLLALTEQSGDGGGGHLKAAQDIVPPLEGEYERAYYDGIVLERQGKAQLRAGGPGILNARACLQEAMERYEHAESVRPAGDDDAVLRWNACARLLMRYGLPSEVEERFEPLLE